MNLHATKLHDVFYVFYTYTLVSSIVVTLTIKVVEGKFPRVNEHIAVGNPIKLKTWTFTNP